MTIAINGIAHVQLTVRDPDACLPFWEKLLHFFESQFPKRRGFLFRGLDRASQRHGMRAGLYFFESCNLRFM